MVSSTVPPGTSAAPSLLSSGRRKQFLSSLCCILTFYRLSFTYLVLQVAL
ncbi:hypothetical protein GBAR_LOCUS20486 [Geodia barretti]|uniref:Uncharacterized protein n=1 Tax=Geodia barretti TaxID=519541 RepID=A0AA35X3D1_GEOBA|nr:hypothetical protein GBAR_LOCUS20486 [Geodia barretti]